MKLIDAVPMHQNWGSVWQSGAEEIFLLGTIPQPRIIVSMIGPLLNITSPQMSYMINDDPNACLRDEVLFALVQSVICHLANGVNVLIHCFQGKSRSAYVDVAIHMRVLKLSYDKAFEYVKAADSLAQPNSGFEAQLRRMEAKLIA